MKKFLFWMVLIGSVLVILGSCAKKDDSTPTTTLSAPTGLTATGNASQVALDWTAVSGASSYTVYWDNATGVSSSSTAITSVSTDSYTHTGLDNGTTYYYKVAAVDSAGTGALSSEVNATTLKYVSTSTTASGSITVGSETMSGVYASPCYTGDLSSLISAGRFPTDTASYGFALVVTGSDNVSDESHMFTDSSCTTNSVKLKTHYDNVTVGSATGNNDYPLTLTKKRSLITAGTTAGETFVEALWQGSINVTVGTEYTDTYTGSTNPRYTLINLSSTHLYWADESSSGTPSSVGDTSLTKQ